VVVEVLIDEIACVVVVVAIVEDKMI